MIGSFEYTVNVSANPSNAGTVTGGGTYEQGQQCTVAAMAAEGYTFTNWTENGEEVSTNASYTFLVNGNRTLVANFSTERYTVSATASPSAGGTVTGGGTYNYGQSCTVAATAATGYVFTNWTENGTEVSTNASYTFNVSGNRSLVANFTQRHTVAVSASPSNGGSATGGGTYNHGQSCTVIATAANGYTFTNWTEGGNVVSTNANYTFTVNNNRALVANFSVQAPNTYTINASPNPSAGGTVTGGGTYEQGQSCTVSATANTGYTFLRWTENGNQVSTNASYQFTVTGNRTLVAQFQLQSYTISASVTPSNSGTVTGAGSYNHGQNCTLTATPNTGYTFVNWTKNGTQVSTDATYTFTVTASASYVAHFQAQSYTIGVSANPTNGGSVTGGGNYNYGQNCTVSATAATGYTFLRWTENGNQISTNANYTFTVSGNRTLVAQFQAQSYTISASANPTSGGSVTGGGSYNHGQSCTLTATPVSGYTFTNWTEGGSQVSTNANYTFTVSGNRTLVANFTLQTTLPTVTTSQVTSITQTTATGGGNVTNSGNATVTERGICWSTSHNPTTSGSHASNGTGTGSFTVNMTGLTANTTYYVRAYATNSVGTAYGREESFTTSQIPTYTIGVSANPTAGGTVTGGGTYQQGQSCTVSATAATGYTFTNWTEGGNVVSTNASYQFTVTGNRVLVANFTEQSYMISVSANPSEGGTVSGGGSYNYGQSCTVSATASAGYTFLRWMQSGTEVSTNANYTFIVMGNSTLVAQFQAQSYTISVSANPSSGGTVSGGGSYNYGQTCTVIATPADNYTFVNWMENGYVVQGTGDSYTFTVTGNRSLVANFSYDLGYVDLGLPSGLLWAQRNVGASSWSEAGARFAWGETTPKTSTTCNWNTYQYCNNGDYYQLSKYCSNVNYGVVDNLTILLPEDDAATANWGTGWRIPTKEEWQELYNNTTHRFTLVNNTTYCMIFTAANGNNLILPIAAYYDENGYQGSVTCNYWSSSLYTNQPYDAWYFGGSSSSCSVSHRSRNCGQAIRAVRSAH